ncbi:unnamed protein product [Caenorhabditis angaria]|uniref:Uncharacterized protein n=1 Tax=Caenorhabditis angaria TaxID=860376 RepID=A0A9P1N7B4_9PELO|nr:unnamed protein product [Caenorhabditis angaria]
MKFLICFLIFCTIFPAKIAAKSTCPFVLLGKIRKICGNYAENCVEQRDDVDFIGFAFHCCSKSCHSSHFRQICCKTPVNFKKHDFYTIFDR